MNRKLIPFLAATLALSYTSKGQITVDSTAPYDDPATLVNDVFLGGGITASNITYTGALNQIGYYEFGVENGVTFSDGLLMSTGQATAVEIGGTPGTGGGINGDIDLLTVAQSVPTLLGGSFTVSSVNDVAKLEFDFVPAGTSVEFNYVFGSDEWLSWINSAFNDVFGFFISGPGITGPYADGAVNIAFIPDTDPQMPITVSSVTPTLNSAYFVPNSASTGGLNNGGHSLNATTTPLQATLEVIPGETYHIVLAIADGTDTALDSSVFFGGGSFKSGVSAYHVVEGGAGQMDGTSMENGAPSISDAFDLEESPGTVIVWDGDYVQNSNLSIPEGMDFWLKNGASIDMGTNNIVNNGEIHIDQNSSIVQGANSAILGDGNFVVYRTSVADADRKNLLSSPVANAELDEAYESSIVKSLNVSNTSNAWVSETSGSLDVGAAYMVNGATSLDFDGVRIYEGDLNNGNITINLNGEDYNDADDHTDYDGWNLVGNPYASKLSIADVMDMNPDVATLGLYYSATDKHVVFNRLNGIESHKIASGQGFYLYTPSSTNLLFTNQMRVSGPGVIYKTASVESSKLILELEGSLGKRYETQVHFMESASNDWDAMYDAPLMPNAYEITIYTLFGDQPHALQAWGAFETDQQIPIGINAVAGSYTIDMNDFAGFPENTLVYLEDLQEGVLHDLNLGDYSFTKDEDGVNNNRFVLRIEAEENNIGIDETVESAIDVQLLGNQLQLNGLGDTPLHRISLYSIDGKEITSWSSPQVSDGQLLIRLNEHATAYYLLHLETGAGTIVHKLHLVN